jgi:hypothetical protein
MISAFTKKIQAYRDKLAETLQEILELFAGQKKEDGSEIESYINW